MPCRALLLLTAALLALAAPASGAPTRSDVRAAVRATLAFDLARGKAVGRAERRADARRAAVANGCLDTVRSAPAAARERLRLLYVAHVGGGYFAEDEPLFARWVRRLRAIDTRDPVLRRTRAALARSLEYARRQYRYGESFCDPVGRWAAAGWAADGRPTRLKRLEGLTAGGTPASGAALKAAARLVRSRGGEGGSLAAPVLRAGVDEPDEKVIRRDDPTVALLGS
jgi:hypothetical protein